MGSVGEEACSTADVVVVAVEAFRTLAFAGRAFAGRAFAVRAWADRNPA